MPHDSYLSNLAQFGDKGVQVFFILSGFVIPYSLCRRSLSDFSPPRFLLRRMTRIHPPYLLAVVLAMATYGLVLGRPGFFDPKVVASNFLYLPSLLETPWLLNVSWTLGVEAQFYLLVSVFHPFLASDSPRKRRTAFTLFLSTCLLSEVLPEGINGWYLLPMWIPFFALGLLLFLYQSGKVSRAEFSMFMAGILLFLLIEYTKLFTLTAAGTAVLIALVPGKAKLPGHSLGKISYSLYLVHLPVMVLLATWLKSLEWFTAPPDLFAIILLLAAILASLPFYLLVEKPSLNWSRKLGSGSKTSERQ